MTGLAFRLLILDADEHFSVALAEEAQSVGLQVIRCANWWEAMPLLEGPLGIDGMIVELALPEGTPNGLSAALMARNRRGPRFPVVFTSLQPELLKEVRQGTGPTLAKSVGVHRLIGCACELMEAQSRQGNRAVPHLLTSPRVSLVPIARYRLDDTTCFRSVNDSALVMWRKNRSELLGRKLLEVFPQMDGMPKLRAHLEVLHGRPAYAGRVRSVVLHDQIDIEIARDRAGLRVSFARAA